MLFNPGRAFLVVLLSLFALLKWRLLWLGNNDGASYSPVAALLSTRESGPPLPVDQSVHPRRASRSQTKWTGPKALSHPSPITAVFPLSEKVAELRLASNSVIDTPFAIVYYLSRLRPVHLGGELGLRCFALFMHAVHFYQ